MVILGGEKKPTDGLYQHKLAENKTAEGVLHAYQQDGKWSFMSQEEYETKKGKGLPDVCLAFKCPIENVDLAFNGPDSIFNFNLDDIIDKNSVVGHTGITSSHTEKAINEEIVYCA
jgi:hypothetical protein